MSARYDLHTHSICSDGTLAPAELVRQAHAAGIEVLALTDHDSTDGLDEAQEEARRGGIGFVTGVEVSVTWNGQTVHIVGLGVDPREPRLQDGLRGLRAFRQWRAEEIARRLERAGIAGALEGARAQCRGPVLSRTHFARFLVASGRARDVREVFARFLVRGRPGHVPGQWAGLEQALEWIRAARGQAVIAHPARYKLSGGKLEQLFREFREHGGVAVEVVSGSHGPDDTRRMAQLAMRWELLASAGSDFHDPQDSWAGLGRLAPLPEDCTPIWRSWEELPRSAASR
jgi:predicted metal-dependent phosphoesterase TrpH